MFPTATDGPVWWPRGYTARREGSEVMVYDADGAQRARTGDRYWMTLPFDVASARHRLVACGVTLKSDLPTLPPDS